MSDHAIALTTMALDAGIFLFLVLVELHNARKKRVRALCPECLEEHGVTVIHLDDVKHLRSTR